MKKPTDALDEAMLAGEDAGELVASLARTLTPRPPSSNVRERLLAAVASPALRWAPLFGKLGALFDLPDAELTRMAERAALASEWQSVPLPGVELFHLQGGPLLAGADAGLVRVQAGIHFPEHRHLGEERVLILEGEARESDGTLRRPGDIVVMPPDSSHDFVVLPGKPLVYALVLFGPVEIGNLRFP
ncbi:MAG: cupin domain-containing protein [Myxococcota bacterium]